MAKPKLDLQIIHDLQPQTLQPLDFMSPMELPEVPTVPIARSWRSFPPPVPIINNIFQIFPDSEPPQAVYGWR